ncbi:nitroreductase family protein [Myxococcota bacterium]
MDFDTLVRARYSVRAYRPDPVPDSRLTQVLEAGLMAPTAANRQPFRLLVVHTEGRREELQRIYPRPWFVQAPLVIGVLGVPDEAWVRSDGKSYCSVDAAIVMDHLVLAATHGGLGTCWVGAFDVQAAREVLGLPVEVEPIAFTPIGYPADVPGPKSRRSLSDLVRYERWQ